MIFFLFIVIATIVPPQDIGVISGLAEYPEQNLKHSNSRSIIHLKTATIEMTGEYTCIISTFQEEDIRRTKMIVYGNHNLVIYIVYILHYC